MSETDSSTSSISTSIQDNDMIIEAKENFLLEPIIYMNNSFEVCLLRIIHILFSEDNTMQHNRLHQYMDNSDWCNMIKDFFYENPGVMKDANFYKTSNGIALIDQWIALLSYKNFFTYKKNNSMNEIIPHLDNFFSFIFNTFPLVKRDDSGNMHTILNSIYSQLNKNTGIVYARYLKCLPKNQAHTSNIQNIYINIMGRYELCYIWEIVDIVETDSTNKITTIYSESELRRIIIPTNQPIVSQKN